MIMGISLWWRECFWCRRYRQVYTDGIFCNLESYWCSFHWQFEADWICIWRRECTFQILFGNSFSTTCKYLDCWLFYSVLAILKGHRPLWVSLYSSLCRWDNLHLWNWKFYTVLTHLCRLHLLNTVFFHKQVPLPFDKIHLQGHHSICMNRRTLHLYHKSSSQPLWACTFLLTSRSP